MLTEAEKRRVLLSVTLGDGMWNPWFGKPASAVDWAKVEAHLNAILPVCDVCGFRPGLQETVSVTDFGDVKVYMCKRCK